MDKRLSKPKPVASRGFTLLEVVLAIGLSVVVLALLTTAIEHYLLRVDASRARVESAQLARTLLTQIADDLRAARYVVPSATPSSGGGSGGLSSGGTAEGSSDGTGSGSADSAEDSSSTGEGSSESSSTADSTTSEDQVLGVFGSQDELRIDRSAAVSWRRMLTESELAEGSNQADLPQSVLYFLREGETLTPAEWAGRSASELDETEDIAGLCREQKVTVALLRDTAPSDVLTSDETRRVALLAPEVVELQFVYSDGLELFDEWDSAERQGLPRSVEIRLKLTDQPWELAGDSSDDYLSNGSRKTVEYRLLVNLPKLEPPRVVAAPRGSQSAQNASEPNESAGNDSDATSDR